MKVKLYKDDGTVVDGENGIVAVSVKNDQGEDVGVASAIFGEFSSITLMQMLARLALTVKESTMQNYGMSEKQFEIMFSVVSDSMTEGDEKDAESNS